MGRAAQTRRALPAGHQRIDRHPLTFQTSRLSRANGFMAKDKRRNTPIIMPMPSVHIRSANPAKGEINHNLTLPRFWGINLPKTRFKGSGIDQGFHSIYPSLFHTQKQIPLRTI
jgi:hypothetical protein